MVSERKRVIELNDAVFLDKITCEFGGTRALNAVSLTFHPSEIHAVTGENGAGKSTLLKVLAGLVRPQSGTIHIQGRAYSSIRYAWKLGIRTIPQEPLLAQSLSVAENIFLGRLPGGRSLRVNWKSTFTRAQQLLDRVGLSYLRPDQSVCGLALGEQQLIQTARALADNGSIFLFDEPTSALMPREVHQLFCVVKRLAAEGAIVLFVSHRMSEIFSVCHRVSVLRDGNYIGTKSIADTIPGELIRMMVGREIVGKRNPSSPKIGQTALRLQEFKTDHHSYPLNLEVNSGEIVGLAGLVGAGRTELFDAVFGIRRHRGRTFVNGKITNVRSPWDAARAGIGYIPENRKRDGVVSALTIQDNLTLANFSLVSRLGVVRSAAARRLSQRWIERLRVKCTGALQPMHMLSGGNQQKIVLAKWLARNPAVLLLDEPTRGVDIGAKAEIHDLIRHLANRGLAILLASSEMSELLELSNRILVMREGVIIDELCGEQMNEAEILHLALPSARHIPGDSIAN